MVLIPYSPCRRLRSESVASSEGVNKLFGGTDLSGVDLVELI